MKLEVNRNPFGLRAKNRTMTTCLKLANLKRKFVRVSDHSASVDGSWSFTNCVYWVHQESTEATMSVARFSEDTSFSIELNSLAKSSPVRYTVTLIKRMVREAALLII